MIELLILSIILMIFTYIFTIAMMVKEIRRLRISNNYWYSLSEEYRSKYLSQLQKRMEDQ